MFKICFKKLKDESIFLKKINIKDRSVTKWNILIKVKNDNFDKQINIKKQKL